MERMRCADVSQRVADRLMSEELTLPTLRRLPWIQGSMTSPQITYPAFMTPSGLTDVARAKRAVATRCEDDVVASMPENVRSAYSGSV